ncbi:MAG: hypothetical protein HKO95_05715 [Rhodobacteraceae bacterium]|nr:hypothetical protein [Alphaproteobacteria bacterium]MBT8474531.1 hypothetical protein [Alphaproteobacteria bacterium]NNF72318.1 hypothetical protein [Paracoccaceae bacterium]NNK66214.1 hypothetical protein [Paracoccaceae bacterium]
MGLIIAAVLLAAFTANVAIGSIAGDPYIGNVGEMLMLFAASIAFSADILKREAAVKKQSNNDE